MKAKGDSVKLKGVGGFTKNYHYDVIQQVVIKSASYCQCDSEKILYG